MDSTSSTLFTFTAGLYDITAQGHVFHGMVQLTIDPRDVNMLALSSNFYLKDIVQTEDLPTFNILDFPAEADDTFDSTGVDFDSAASMISANVPADIGVGMKPHDNDQLIDLQTNEIENMSDFEAFEGDELIEDVCSDEFVPINHPFHQACVKVSRKGEVILDVDEDTKKTARIRILDRDIPSNTNININKISKENKCKNGAIVSFEIFRNHAWLKVGDFHLATEIIKTFQPELVLLDIEVIYLDGDFNNCRIDNLFANIKTPHQMKPAIHTCLPNTADWTYNKFWNRELMYNSISSFDGNIASVIETGDIEMKQISAKAACYSVNIAGVKYDARKLIWRAFTDTEPVYSSEHYKIHVIFENKPNKLSFDNLKVTLISSIFEQWSTEDEIWPWTRSKKGVVPKEQRAEKKASSSKTGKKAAAKQTSSKPPSPCKIVAPAKPVIKKKYVKKMSEKKFQELKHLVKMNLTITRKDYELYLEQKTLRRLNPFLG